MAIAVGGGGGGGVWGVGCGGFLTPRSKANFRFSKQFATKGHLLMETQGLTSGEIYGTFKHIVGLIKVNKQLRNF